MANQSLLIELLTEELPPKSLARLSEAFSRNVLEGLKEKGFLSANSAAEPFATPRRLAVRVSDVLAKQPDRVVERKGPAVAAGYGADGQPTPALLGFAKSCGVEVTKLEKRQGDKGEQFVYSFKQKGEPLAKHLAAVVETGLKKLPVAKMMRWGSGEAQFVRPVHGLIMLHGAKVIPGEVLGIKSGKKTLGHRFLSEGVLIIKQANDYEKTLKTGKVIASFKERRDAIVKGLDEKATEFRAKWRLDGPGLISERPIGNTDQEQHSDDLAAANWILRGNEDLLDEVVAIVEWPVVYVGEFEQEFLEVPSQCIGLTMQKNQRYFALVDKTAKLLSKYLIVSNIKTNQPARIVDGNARVLRARLSDAKFFYDQDRTTKLSDRVPRLANVVYHNKLGSQLERVERIQKLAGEVARLIKADASATERAAHLAKADLLTEMVGEFPELQGLMGYHYALHDDEGMIVAGAIREHYLPRFAGDVLPRTNEGVCLALADKLDTLVGIYGIGLVPTGDKDPFGLRRQALGVIRILIESKSLPSLDVLGLLQMACSYFPNGVIADGTAQGLYAFMLERLKPYLREKGLEPDEIDAVLSLNPTRLDQVMPRLRALQQFRTLPEAAALAAANKRIRNILRQAGGTMASEVDSGLLKEEAEKKLAAAVQALHGQVMPLLKSGDYAKALKLLATLRPAVDEFFDKVMVMADDMAVRNNRLALLNSLSNLFLHVADISRLQG